MPTRLEAIDQAKREGAGRAWMAVVSEPDDHTGLLTFGYCPVYQVPTLYGVQIKAGLVEVVATIDPGGHVFEAGDGQRL